MKAAELQIGYWVCYSKPNGYVTRVDDIRRYGDESIGYEYAISCKRDERDPLYEKAPVDSFNVEIIHPIPLTPEILKMNGFREDRPGITYRYRKFGETTIDVIDVFFHSNGKVTATINGMTNDVYCNYVHCYCGHVHELQHAMRLCRIDKEIELED